MSRWFLSDEQFIERVRRGQRYRRPLGALCGLLGIVGVALTLYWVHDLSNKSLAGLSELQHVENPTTQQVAHWADHARFNIGLSLGFMIGTSLSAAPGLATSGIILLFQNRKDKLLLRCWDARTSAS